MNYAVELQNTLDRLSNEAQCRLIERAKKAIDIIKDVYDEDILLLHTYGCAQPIYKEDPHDGNLSDTISGFSYNDESGLAIHVDTYESGYEVTNRDLDIEIVIYLIECLDLILDELG
jgi:hypothetical protein